MYGINPVHELLKLLPQADEPAPAAKPAPAPAPQPSTFGDTKLSVARDLLKHRLAAADLAEANGKDPARIADQLVAPLVPAPTAKPKAAPRLAPTERELELMEQAAQAVAAKAQGRKKMPVGISPSDGSTIYGPRD